MTKDFAIAEAKRRARELQRPHYVSGPYDGAGFFGGAGWVDNMGWIITDRVPLLRARAVTVLEIRQDGGVYHA